MTGSDSCLRDARGLRPDRRPDRDLQFTNTVEPVPGYEDEAHEAREVPSWQTGESVPKNNPTTAFPSCRRPAQSTAYIAFQQNPDGSRARTPRSLGRVHDRQAKDLALVPADRCPAVSFQQIERKSLATSARARSTGVASALIGLLIARCSSSSLRFLVSCRGRPAITRPLYYARSCSST